MDLIKEEGIVVSDKEIILSSGEKTHFYYNVKKDALDPNGANLIGATQPQTRNERSKPNYETNQDTY